MKQKIQQTIALFSIMLFVTLPIYSADALAVSMEITGNTGTEAVPNFINANGDVWTVDALIREAPTEVTTEDVMLRIGSNEQQFTSCSPGSFGTICQYISQLPDGVREGTYRFEVLYNYLDEQNEDTSSSVLGDVKADGSAPKITIISAPQQSGGEIALDFSISDEISAGKPAAGLQNIQVVDVESNVVLFEANEASGLSGTSFNFGQDGGTQGKVAGQFTGEGVKVLQIQATDLLGHQSEERRSVVVDFIPPEIINLSFSGLAEFIGGDAVASPMVAHLRESSYVDSRNVKAFSNQADLVERAADRCTQINREERIWQCEWDTVVVAPETSIEVVLQVTDEFDNEAQSTLRRSFTADTSGPEIVEFKTDGVFEGKNYVRNRAGEERNRIWLKVTENGAGVKKEDVQLNLNAFGEGSRSPDYFDLKTYEMYWDVGDPRAGSGSVSISFTKFQDSVGNKGKTEELQVKVDSTGPQVKLLQITGIDQSGNEHEWIQSNDRMKIAFSSRETSGIVVIAQLAGLVDNAETKYPATERDINRRMEHGAAIFRDQDISCERDKDDQQLWNCVVITEPLMSGTGEEERLRLFIRDTAGNDARYDDAKFTGLRRSGSEFWFRFLGLDTEEQPDHWSVRANGVQGLLPFVNLDTVSLFPTRMPVEVTLNRRTSRAELIGMNLPEGSCVPGQNEGIEVPKIQRALLLDKLGADGTPVPKPVITLEFEPFDKSTLVNSEQERFEKVTVNYVCNLLLFTRIGDNAFQFPEVQEVPIAVDFAFDDQGAVDENIAKRVQELQDDWFFKHTAWVQPLNDALRWVNFILNFYYVAVSVEQIINLAADAFKTSASTTEKTGYTIPVVSGFTETAGTILRGGCFSVESTLAGFEVFTEYLRPIMQLLACDYNAFTSDGEVSDALGWYAATQKGVMETYNYLTGRELLGMPATSPHENLFLSMLTLCIPGMLYNVQKAREIRCRQIICYANEVPSGITTINQCNNMYDLLMCEFVWGAFWSLVPGIELIHMFGQMIQTAFSSPLGLISLTETVACGFLCFDKTDSGGFLTTCKAVTFVNKIIGVANSVAGAIQANPSITATPYCDQAAELDLGKLAGAVPKETAEPVSDSSPASGSPPSAVGSTSPPEVSTEG